MIKKERLDKILSNMGYGSRKDVKKLIKAGRVMINNNIETKQCKINPMRIYYNRRSKIRI